MACQENQWKHFLRRGRRWEYLIFLAVLASFVYIVRMPNYKTLDVVIREQGHMIGEISTAKHVVYEQATSRIQADDSHSLARTLVSEGGNSNTSLPHTGAPVVKPTASAMSKHVVICTQTGRLGNLMFTYASLYGIAKRKNMSVVIDVSNPLLTYFKLDSKPVNIATLHGYVTLTESRACDYDEKVTMFDADKDVLIKSYLQSWKYFFHVEDLVRSQFRFQDPVIEMAVNTISKIRKEKSQKVNNATVTVIGLHYRRGDKIKKHYVDFGYVMAPMDYIKRAMAYFRLYHTHVVFVLTSDSPDFVKTALPDNDIVHFGKHSDIEDMAILAHCDHLITTIGTFGWWAGFLGKGKVLYYKYPAREGSNFRKDFGESYGNFFHPKWTGLR